MDNDDKYMEEIMHDIGDDSYSKEFTSIGYKNEKCSFCDKIMNTETIWVGENHFMCHSCYRKAQKSTTPKKAGHNSR